MGDVMNKYDKKYIEIGKKIAKYRKLKNITQEELANTIGISYSYLTQIEAPNVIKRMSLEVLFDISSALEIDIKDLL